MENPIKQVLAQQIRAFVDKFDVLLINAGVLLRILQT
jgi:hypothetical protein